MTVEEIRRQHADWRVYRTDQLGTPDYEGRPGSHPVVSVVLPGCSPKEAIEFDDGTDRRAAECARSGSNGDVSALSAINESSLKEADVAPEIAATLRSGA